MHKLRIPRILYSVLQNTLPFHTWGTNTSMKNTMVKRIGRHNVKQLFQGASITMRMSRHIHIVKKGICLYSAVSSPLYRSECFRLQTCSLRRQLDFSGKHFFHAAITREDYSFTFQPLSIARYSFRQLSELGCHGENENAQALKQWQRGFEPGLS